MRKIFSVVFLFLAFGAMLLSGGCKKDNVDGKIAGKWTFVEIDYLTNVYSRDSTFLQSFDGGSYLELNPDKTFSAIIDLSYSGTWQTAGKQLTLLYAGDSTSSTFDVQKLNSRELVLFMNTPNDSGFVQSTWHLRK